MANFFDQFDEAAPAEQFQPEFGDRPNFFDQFDQFDPTLSDGAPPIPAPFLPANMSGRAPTTGEEVLSAAESFGAGGLDPISGLAQMLSRAVPEGVAQGINTAGQALTGVPGIGPVAEKLGLGRVLPADVDEGIQAQDARLQAGRGPDAGTFDPARLAGNVAITAPAAALAGPGAAAAIGTGAAIGATMPVTQIPEGGSFLGEKLKQTGFGAAGGAGGNLLGKGLARVVNPQTSQAVKGLLKRNITPTPGQILGGGFKSFEDKLTSVPFLGDAIKTGQRRGIRQFNTAIFDDILKPIGAASPRGVGREAVEVVGDTIGKGYDDVLSKIGLSVDDHLAAEVSAVRAAAQELPPQLQKRFETVLRDKVIGQLAKNSSGRGFKTVQSSLTEEAAKFGKSTDAFQRELGERFTDLLSTLQEGLGRSNAGVRINVGGQVVDAGQRVSDLNLAWAKLVRLEKAAGATGAFEGVFTPAQLSAAVKAADRSTRKRAFARGDALLQEISDPAKSVLSSTVPDSGTPGRLLAILGGGGLAAAEPATAATLATAGGAATLPFTPFGQRLTAALLARRPQSAATLANAIRGGLPAFQATGAGLSAAGNN